MEYLSDYTKDKAKELVEAVGDFLNKNFESKEDFDFDFIFADDTAARILAFVFKKALQKRGIFIPTIYLASSGAFFDGLDMLKNKDEKRKKYFSALLKYFKIKENSKALVLTDIIKQGVNLSKIKMLLEAGNIDFRIFAVNDRSHQTADYNLDQLSLANFLYSSTELRGVKRHSGIPPKVSFDLAFAIAARKFISAEFS